MSLKIVPANPDQTYLLQAMYPGCKEAVGFEYSHSTGEWLDSWFDEMAKHPHLFQSNKIHDDRFCRIIELGANAQMLLKREYAKKTGTYDLIATTVINGNEIAAIHRFGNEDMRNSKFALFTVAEARTLYEQILNNLKTEQQ